MLYKLSTLQRSSKQQRVFVLSVATVFYAKLQDASAYVQRRRYHGYDSTVASSPNAVRVRCPLLSVFPREWQTQKVGEAQVDQCLHRCVHGRP